MNRLTRVQCFFVERRGGGAEGRRGLLIGLVGLLVVLVMGCAGESAAPVTPPAEPMVTAEPTVISEPTETPTVTPEPTAVPEPSAHTYNFGRDLYPALADLGEGWTKIEPGGDTRCAHDTPFAFWVRPGTVNKLLLYFEGGGGCWNAETCAAGSRWYDSDVGVDEDPSRRNGVFDFDNPANPFKDYHAVFIPSCTGDVHWGTTAYEYPYADASRGTVTVYHHGYINGQAALAWAYDNVLEPESVFVTGCSAGSVGSVAHASDVIAQYPQARVTQLGDSLAFIFGEAIDLTDWGTQAALPAWMDTVTADDLLMRHFVIAVANHHPDYTFAQYNTEADEVQIRYYATDGGPDAAEFPAELAGHLSDIHAAAPNFRSYTATGSQHCILPRTNFYTTAVNEVSVVDWVRALADGEAVQNVVCPTCAVETGEGE